MRSYFKQKYMQPICHMSTFNHLVVWPPSLCQWGSSGELVLTSRRSRSREGWGMYVFHFSIEQLLGAGCTLLLLIYYDWLLNISQSKNVITQILNYEISLNHTSLKPVFECFLWRRPHRIVFGSITVIFHSTYMSRVSDYRWGGGFQAILRYIIHSRL